MSTRPPQPPAKQFILRQRASDKELLELYFRQDDCIAQCNAINALVKGYMKAAQEDLDSKQRELGQLVGKIARAKEQVQTPVIAVMDPAKSEKTLFYPEDTTFQTPIAVIPMLPEDYELPLL